MTGYPSESMVSSVSFLVQLGISKSTYQVQMTTLSEHPVGNSVPGNAVLVSTVDFQPFGFYCFCDVHEEGSMYCKHCVALDW